MKHLIIFLATIVFGSIAVIALLECSERTSKNKKTVVENQVSEIESRVSEIENQFSVMDELAAITSSPVIVDMKGNSTLAIWLKSEIKKIGTQFRDIYEAELKRVNGSENFYDMRLDKSREISGYIEVHFIHEVSDPEIHGVIDPVIPKLISIFEDGGA